jgi:uncharacterized protein with LGFP repeats
MEAVSITTDRVANTATFTVKHGCDTFTHTITAEDAEAQSGVILNSVNFLDILEQAAPTAMTFGRTVGNKAYVLLNLRKVILMRARCGLFPCMLVETHQRFTVACTCA